jgi:phospholipase/carboxylesterase
MTNDSFISELDGWTFRIQPPQSSEPAQLLILLHGWTGDENVMWIFTRRLSRRYWLLAPRGPVSAPEGGFGWLPPDSGLLATVQEFRSVIDSLLERIDAWALQKGVDSRQVSLMGFSQGAAAVYAAAMMYPERVWAAACLAGYLPGRGELLESRSALAGKPFYIAHGSLDETVPVSQARHAVAALKNLGASVTYCEAEVGHKLSAGCLNGLETFFG